MPIKLPAEISVRRNAGDGPWIHIDGELFPWYTAGVSVNAVSHDEMPTVTITIPAERVTLFNDVAPPPKETSPDERTPAR